MFSPLLSTLLTCAVLHGIRSWPLEITFLPLSPSVPRTSVTPHLLPSAPSACFCQRVVPPPLSTVPVPRSCCSFATLQRARAVLLHLLSSRRVELHSGSYMRKRATLRYNQHSDPHFILQSPQLPFFPPHGSTDTSAVHPVRGRE